MQPSPPIVPQPPLDSMALDAERHVRRYLSDHADIPPEYDALPAPRESLRATIVIPAYDELERLGAVLDSLEEAAEQPERFEVIVVVNQPADAPPEIAEANRETLRRLEARDDPFPLHPVDRCTDGRALPPDEAGVGRARRLAMDLALARLADAGRAADGLIPCLDADSPAAPGYVDRVCEAFDRLPPEALAGVCRYRHPIPEEDEHARAIAAYESWMRYFEAGLRLTNTPYAFQSIGSCMVLTARGYALADGVPPRPALSDFYLLQKVVKAGGRGAVRPLEGPLVFPSARPSGRVPRGTGPSVQSILEHDVERYTQVEPPAVFRQLAAWFEGIEPGFEDLDALLETPDPLLADYLEKWKTRETLDKLRRHAPDAAHFERHVHEWFDSLKIVKFANFARRRGQTTPLIEAVGAVLEDLGLSERAARLPDVSPPFETDALLETLEVLRDCESEWV